MDTFYLVCAGLGGTILLLQLVAGALGMGADHDTDHDSSHDSSHDAAHDHGGNWFLGMLGVRTVAAALTFFGLGGLSAGYYGANAPSTIGLAIGSGALAFFAVGFLIRSLGRLRSDGTVRIDRAVGRTGAVYLRVPGSRAGAGKIHLAVQNRTVEYQAMTAGPELPTGAPIRVVGIVNTDTVEVEAA